MKKILVIEDNEEVRDNILEILELSGYGVFAAENGKAGVEIALEEKPDLIVCDIMMPVIDGFGVLHLLNKHKETTGIPFIFLTAKSEKADLRKGMESGADDYLTKPFDGTELLKAISVRLQKSEHLKKVFGNTLKDIDDFIQNAGQSGEMKFATAEREVCEYKKKHMLYTEGQRPKYVYFVIAGRLKTYKTNDEGKELITKIYGPGDFFGYVPILEAINYNDNAQLLEDTTLRLIPKTDFLQLITHDINIAGKFIKIITHNLVEKEEVLLNFAYNSLRRKVAYGLIQLLETIKEDNTTEPPNLYITRKNMAHISGVTTESLIRTLSDFKEEKLIDFEKGKIVLLNENKLRNLPN